MGLLPSFTNGPSQGGVRKVRPTWDWPRPFEPPRKMCQQLLSVNSVSCFHEKIAVWVHVLVPRELLGSLSPCIGPDRVWQMSRTTLLWFQDCLPTCRLAPLGKPSGAGVLLLDAGENPPAFPVSLFDVGSRPPRRRMREIPPSFCTSAGATLGSEDRNVFCYLGLHWLISDYFKFLQISRSHRHSLPQKALHRFRPERPTHWEPATLDQPSPN